MLTKYDQSLPHSFVLPTKKIHDGPDMSFFLASQAFGDIMTFLMQLNHSMFPRSTSHDNSVIQRVEAYELQSPFVTFSDTVKKLCDLLNQLDTIIDEVPLDSGPRRFGNVSFRKWSELVEERASGLLEQYLPAEVVAFKHDSEVDATAELRAYFLGSFGSAQRLDYGTGHELSFLAFLGGIWKLGGFPSPKPGEEERGIVLGVINQYLTLVRRLILQYTLEPAGSHGVWGLDDHSFLPYVFGSAQLGPPIQDTDPVPIEGSMPGAPDPSGVARANLVEKERMSNMYFGAIGFIYDVKTGPFWEHSPTLYDISGIRTGWGKINKGMIKMFSVEVLSKLPVVQHFPFGSLFSWEQDPHAAQPTASIHTASQPPRVGTCASTNAPEDATKAPWSHAAPNPTNSGTPAPWTNKLERTVPKPPRSINRDSPSRARIPAAAMTQHPSVASGTDMKPRTPPPTGAPWAA